MRECSVIGFSQQLYLTRFEDLRCSYDAATWFVLPGVLELFSFSAASIQKIGFARAQSRYHTGFIAKSAALMLKLEQSSSVIRRAQPPATIQAQGVGVDVYPCSDVVLTIWNRLLRLQA